MIAAMCTDAYREALTRAFSSKASSAPPRRRANPGQDDPESRGVAAAGPATQNGQEMALAHDATAATGEAIGQR